VNRQVFVELGNVTHSYFFHPADYIVFLLLVVYFEVAQVDIFDVLFAVVPRVEDRRATLSFGKAVGIGAVEPPVW